MKRFWVNNDSAYCTLISLIAVGLTWLQQTHQWLKTVVIVNVTIVSRDNYCLSSNFLYVYVISIALVSNQGFHCQQWRRSRGDRGDASPQNLGQGDSNVICPPTFGLYFWVEIDERGAHTNSKSGSEATGMLISELGWWRLLSLNLIVNGIRRLTHHQLTTWCDGGQQLGVRTLCASWT